MADYIPTLQRAFHVKKGEHYFLSEIRHTCSICIMYTKLQFILFILDLRTSATFDILHVTI